MKPDCPNAEKTQAGNGEDRNTSERIRLNIRLISLASSETSGGSCDPMIDEHFRRSLGKDYVSSADEGDTSDSADNSTATSLSVDDHFAKALGDNWLELQRENEEKKKTDGNGKNERRKES
ncbi:unnamed protein product [Nesidiocoris tenuis]|uniref:Transcription cofactor vestigial-like protein 4 n=1 Tax=Nesidiocoris tenuis TaxID=355587 RepID=A0A6H5H2S6_9HEMI|nr:unnamed protein product [Nesidiocoris tenuis]